MTGAPRLLSARRWIYAYAAFAVPVLYGASFPASGLAWIGWIGFVPWFVAVRIAPTRTALLLCCVSTFLGSYFCTPWLARAVANYYQQPLAVGVGLFAGVWLVTIGPFLVAFTLAFRALARQPSRWLPLLAAAAWTGAEIGRARLFVGDPFGLYGYSQVTFTTLAQIADVTGVYGLTLLPMAVNAALAELWLAHAPPAAEPDLPAPAVATRGEAWRGAALVALAVVAALAYGTARIHTFEEEEAAPARIAVVQGNLDLGTQWRPDFYGRNLEDYMRLTAEVLRREPAELVVWPESAMTFFLDEEPAYRASLASLLTPFGVELVAGGPRRVGAGEASYFNSAFAVARDGSVTAVYDKQRLLPFAEYFPFGGIALLRRHFGRVREFTPGGPATLLPTVAGAAGVLICNESMFGEMASERVHAGAEVLVTLANDSWLSDPKYAGEAFDMARLRAVEQRRYLVRASTSGPSAIVDPLGRVVGRTADDTRATLSGTIRPAQTLTPYARWGDVFGVLCALLPLSVLALRRVGRGRRAAATHPSPAAAAADSEAATGVAAAARTRGSGARSNP